MEIMKVWRLNRDRYLWRNLVIYSIEYTVVVLQILLAGKISGFAVRPPDGETTPVPSILNHNANNISATVGGRAILKCKVKNLGTKTVIWRKADKKDPLTIGSLTYSPEKRFQVRNIPQLDEWNLIIKGVKRKDAGVYECQISSKDRSIREQVFLTVQGISISNTTYVEKGDKILLECNATSDDVDWFRKGHKLITDDAKGIKITKKVFLRRRMITSTLAINKSTMADDTDFVCRDSDMQSSYVKVHVLNDDSPRNKRYHKNSSNGTGSSYKGSREFIDSKFISTLFYFTIINWFICR